MQSADQPGAGASAEAGVSSEHVDPTAPVRRLVGTGAVPAVAQSLKGRVRLRLARALVGVLRSEVAHQKAVDIAIVDRLQQLGDDLWTQSHDIDTLSQRAEERRADDLRIQRLRDDRLERAELILADALDAIESLRRHADQA